MSMTEDATIAIDRTTLQSVYTCTQPGMEPGRWPTDRAHPTVWLLVVTVPSCIRPSKRLPLKRNCTGTVKCPRVATRVSIWGWSHSHLSPTDTPLSSWQVWYRTCRAQLDPNPTLGGVVCTKRSSEKVCPLTFRPGRASSCPPNVSKTPTLVLRKPYKRECTEECTPSPISDRLFRAHPRKSTQNAFSYRFYPTHAKNHYSHPNTCIVKLNIYTRWYIT
jgi:hypothetical protein